MSVLEIRLLGNLTVVGDHGPIALGPLQQRLVIVRLAIDPGRAVPTDQLVEALWGDAPPSAPVDTLQTYISKLRRVLEPDRPARAAPRVLVSEAPGYALRLPDEAFDTVAFERSVREGREHLAGDRVEASAAALQAALDLWRGPALADAADAPFAQATIARLGELRLVAVEELAAARLALGDHAIVAADLEPVVEQHPLRERLRAQLALARYRSGRQADALEVLDGGRRVLREELGLDPSPPLVRLRARILAQDPALDVARAEPPTGRVAGPVTPPAGAAPAAAAPTFVGRQAELRRLAALVDEVGSGSGRIVVIEGDPGAGKTRLAMEASTIAAGRGAAVAWGSCHGDVGAPAFWPWAQVGRQLARNLDGAAPGPADPSLPGGDPLAVAGSTDPGEARFRMFRGLHDALHDAAARRPLVLVIDDLHWADDGTLHLLEFLAADVVAARILLIVTCRDTDVPRGSVLAGTLATLARSPATTRCSLGGLTLDEVAVLLRAAVSSAPDREVVAAVHERTAGNPFFVHELARVLGSQGALPYAATPLPGLVPPGVRDVVRHRLDALGTDTNALLRVAATLGRDVELAGLVRASGLRADRCLELLDRALAVRVLEPAGRGAAAYRFVHPLVRDAVLADQSELELARLHAQVVAALTADGDGDDDAELIAHHAAAAAPVVGEEVALDRLDRAAEVALRRLAYESAIAADERAVQLCAALPTGAERDQRELRHQIRLAALRMIVHGYAGDGVVRACERARELARRLPDATPELSAAVFGLAVSAVVRNDLGAADALARQLLRAAHDGGDPTTVGYAHHQLAVNAFQRGRFGTARRHFDRALSVLADGRARTAGGAVDLIGAVALAPDVVVPAFAAVASALTDDAARTSAHLARARRGATAQGSAFSQAVVDMFTAWVAVVRGDRDLARRHARRVVDSPSAGFFPLYTAIARVFLGWSTGSEDRDGALRAIDRGRHDLAGTGAEMLQPLFLGLRAEVLAECGSADDALADVTAGRRIAEVSGEHMWIAELLRLEGVLLRARGESAAAAAATDRALRVAVAQRAPLLADRVRATAAVAAEGPAT